MTAKNIGTALIVVSAVCCSAADSVSVNVSPTVSSIAVTPPTATVRVGESLLLDAVMRDALGTAITSRTPTWASSNSNVATVTNGVVVGRQQGTVRITASADGATGHADLVVQNVAIASLVPSEPSLQLTLGATYQLSVTARDAAGNALSGRSFVWTSSNVGVATVTQGGLVTGTGIGTADITIMSEGVTSTVQVTVPPTAVHSISLAPSSLNLLTGAGQQVVATLRDAAGNVLTGREVSWSSSFPNVAGVSSTGMVTAQQPGFSIITASVDGRTAQATVTVADPPPSPVATISISPSGPTVQVGGTVQLDAILRDAGGNVLDRNVTWASSNTSRATVTQDGEVRGVSTGTATVTATSEGRSAQVQVTVVAPPPTSAPVASVTIAPASPSVQVGGTVQLSATLRDASGNVLSGRAITWSSNNGDRATVSSTGLVSALAQGAATIVAWSEGVAGEVTVNVQAAPLAPVATVAITPASPSVVVGGSVQLEATLRDAAGNVLTGRSVSWSSSNTGRATVSSSGVVTGVSTGSVTITATSEGRSAQVTFSVATPPSAPVATVSVTPSPATVLVGDSVQLTAVLRDAAGNSLGGRPITWTSSNTSRATVSASGMVRGLSTGSVTITAASEGKTAQVTVTVSQPAVASVTLTPSAPSVAVGQTVQLVATLRDAGGNVLSGRSISWSSNRTFRATVSSSGVVTGISTGTATITATSEGRSAQVTVTVVSAPPAPVATVSLSPSTASVQAGSTVQLAATLRDAGGNTLTGRAITWSSSNTLRATVSSSGLVTGVSAGSATITATAEGVSATSSISVTTAPSSPGTLDNECSSMQAGWIWCDDFSQDRLGSYFEYDNAGGRFVREAGAGVNGSQGMRATYAVGQSNAGSLKLAFGARPSSYFRAVDAGTANYREVYWRVFVRTAPDWTGGGGDKFTRAIVFANNNWAEAAIGHVWSMGSGNNFLGVDAASGTDAAGALRTTSYNDFSNLRWLGSQAGSLPLFASSNAGNWYCVETRMRLNDAGQSNGVFEMWIDGQLQAQRTGLNWLGSYSTYGINALFVENFWNAGPPKQQSRYLDNLVVSTQPIGCGNGSAPPPSSPPPTSPPPPTQPVAPSAVTDLRSVGSTQTSVSLRWTGVSDGNGGSAKYAVRVGSPTLTWSQAAGTERLIPAGQNGASIDFLYNGLTAGTNYQFQVVSYRGTLGVDAVLGPLSNVITAATSAPSSGGSEPWFSWDWNNFSTTAQMRSAAHFCCNGTVSLETGVLPDGSTGKFMRAHLRGNGTEDVTDYDIRLPAGAREIWLEFWLRYDPNWRIRLDDKTFFLFSNGEGARRWELHYGAWSTRVYAGVGNNTKEFIVSDSDPGQFVVVNIFDGKWHRHRIYARMASSSTATDGAFYWWVDDTVLLSNSKAAAVSGGTGNNIRTGNLPADFFHSIRLGANADPYGSGIRDWGPIKAWTTNPGW